MSVTAELVEVGPGFWNLRGSFMFEAMDIGTQMSFIRLKTGKFLVIDTCDVSDTAKAEIDTLTDNGSLIEAVLATHPFHSMYFTPFYKMYPNAKFYGTPRHLRNNTVVPWTGCVNDLNVMSLWDGDDVFIRIPDCSDFVNHAMSAFVFHKSSHTLHDDDTVNTHPDGTMDFHPQVLNGLFKTADAPQQFYTFINRLIEDWDFDNLVAGHSCVKVGGAKALLVDTLADLKPKLDMICKKLSS